MSVLQWMLLFGSEGFPVPQGATFWKSYNLNKCSDTEYVYENCPEYVLHVDVHVYMGNFNHKQVIVIHYASSFV